MKRVVVIADLGWSIHRVHKGVEAALGAEYSFTYFEARSFVMKTFIAAFRESDICMTTMNFYSDMLRLFPTVAERRKIVIVAHGIRELGCVSGEACADFTYGVTSAIIRQSFLERLKQPVHVAPNGVDPAWFHHKERDGVIRTVGWCGSPGISIKRIEMAKAIAAACGVELKIAATVPSADMPAWYDSIDLLVVTSGSDVTVESGPLPPFEASVAGVPVIASPCGNWSFVPGPTFQTVEEGVALLQSLMADPERVRCIADEQRACVLANWTYEALAPAWRSLFEDLCKKRTHCSFTNDANVSLALTNHPFSETFRKRDNHEVLFRRISTHLIQSGAIKGSIIDLGAWIGDNSIPWAKQIGTERFVYAIDPSPDNCAYIADMCALNNVTNVRIIQRAISDKTEVLSTNESLTHCSFVYGNPGSTGATKVEACSLDQLGLADIGYIHLDVEGMEGKVLAGAERLLTAYRPIVAFEQHLNLDNYRGLSARLIAKGYTVYMIDEVLPGCRSDCRNLLAFPTECISKEFLEAIPESHRLVPVTPSS